MSKNYEAIGRYTEAKETTKELCQKGSECKKKFWDLLSDFGFYSDESIAKITPEFVESAKKSLDFILATASDVRGQKIIIQELVDTEPYIKELELKLASAG